MRRPHLTLFATLLSGLTCCAVSAQRPSPTARLQSARALYYNPAAAGLESFSCRVQPDWKAILTQATHAPVTDDNLFLVHLNSVQISTIDRLSGLGELHWHNTATPDEKFAASANEMQLSVSQMFQGIYQSWNAYLNGSMFPYGDTTATSDAAGGVHVKYVQSKMATEEIYDKNMLLTEARFATDGLAVIAIPTLHRYARRPHYLFRHQRAAPATLRSAYAYRPVGDLPGRRQVPHPRQLPFRDQKRSQFRLCP